MTKEDYIGEDGLLHCGVCDEAKEAYIPIDNIWGKDRRIRNCRCVREYYEAQKAEDACRMEHIISETTLAAMKKYLESNKGLQ